MSLFYWIIAIIVFNFVLERVLDFLNDSKRSPTLPPEAEGIYDAEKYARSQEYQKVRGRFGLLSSSISFVGLLVVLWLDGFAWLDEAIRQQFTNHPIYLALFFFGALGLASDILGLPFSLYSTFVIEEKFGFNKTTPKTYMLDKLKGYVLGLLLGAPILALVVWFYHWAGENFWLWVWALVTGFTLFMSMFYGSLILPLFNKLTPLEEGPLREKIESYCKKVGFNLTNLFVMDGSKRSSKANAFFAGLGPKKKIVLYDTLINNHEHDELLAVLAHEVGHYKRKHTQQAMVLSVLQTGLMLYVLSLVIGNPALSEALGVSQPSFHIGILAFGMLYSPMSMLLGIFMNVLSRKNEYEADAYAKETFNSQPLATALKKLSVDNLSNLTPHPLYVFFHYSHPTLLQRLKAMRET